jgi:hypothetical protein
MKATWRITKNLTNANPNPLTVIGKTATTIQEKLNAFADILEQIFTTNSDADCTMVSTYQTTTWWQNPEDHNMNINVLSCNAALIFLSSHLEKEGRHNI